jgi:SAM-dependent methyltransferase
MAHQQQKSFCLQVLEKFPEYFIDKNSLDIGSLDINGNNRFMFNGGTCIGIDIAEGKNVDVISKGHELTYADNSVDVIISTECFEHDMYYDLTLKNIIRMLKPGGIFLFTCASTGRPEHGTLRTSKENAPLLEGE